MTLAADALADAGARPTLLTDLLPTCRAALGAAEGLLRGLLVVTDRLFGPPHPASAGPLDLGRCRPLPLV